MARIKLTMKDVAGNLFDNYEKKYQDILKKYNDANATANQFREDLRNKKLTENRQNSLTEANDLARTFKQELTTQLTNKRDEYIKLQEENKNNNTEIETAFANSDYGNNIKALKLIYDSIEENSKLMQANAILEIGYIPSIEKLIDDNLGNNVILGIIEAYVKSQPNAMNKFQEINLKLQDAETTEVDDINKLLGVIRYMSANYDLFPTIDSIGGVSSRNVSNDFNNFMKSEYFGTSDDSKTKSIYFS